MVDRFKFKNHVRSSLDVHYYLKRPKTATCLGKDRTGCNVEFNNIVQLCGNLTDMQYQELWSNKLIRLEDNRQEGQSSGRTIVREDNRQEGQKSGGHLSGRTFVHDDFFSNCGVWCICGKVFTSRL